MVYVDPNLEHECITVQDCGCVWAFDLRSKSKTKRDRRLLACDCVITEFAKSVNYATYHNDNMAAVPWQ